MAVSEDDLVRIDSCLDPPRAELVRMALAREEIPSAFGSANFISWFWHYSNAVGGVKIYVRRREAKLAHKVLADARAKTAEGLPPWTCPACGQRVAGQWDACWHCGRWADGSQDGHAADDSASQPAGHAEPAAWWDVPRVFAVSASAALAMLLLARGPQLPLAFAPFAIVLYFLLRQFEPSSSGRQPELQEAATPAGEYPSDRPATRSEVSRAIVRRAWQAGGLGIGFPPLGFYSMWLLWRVGRRNTPLGRADTCRCWAVFVLNLGTMAFCLAFVAMLLGALVAVLR
jgi:hypothetical protein